MPPAGAGMQSSPSRVGLGAHQQGLIRGPWREAPDLAGGPGGRVTGSGSESCWVTGRAGSGLGPRGEAEAGLSLEEHEKAARWSIPWVPPSCSHRCWLWTQGSSLVRAFSVTPAFSGCELCGAETAGQLRGRLRPGCPPPSPGSRPQALLSVSVGARWTLGYLVRRLTDLFVRVKYFIILKTFLRGKP